MQLFFKRRRHREAGYEKPATWLWMYIRSRQNAEFAFRALGLQLHILAITELFKGQLCPIAQEYSPHVIVITGNNFIHILISALPRI